MYRLLIADDEESIREGVAGFIRRACPEWVVTALARDGREALALARETLPDAVLTDIMMPHKNGLEFLESLAEILPDAKLLVLSGYDQFEYAVQAMRLGVEDYLLKPLDTAKLVDALKRIADELDAQTLRWEQAEALRADAQRTNAWELQNFFADALMGEKLPSLSAANAALSSEEGGYCCVLCEGMDERQELLERLLTQRLYGTARTVLVRVGAPLRQAIVVCTNRRGGGIFVTLSHALTSIAVFCRRTEGLAVHFFIGCEADTPEKLHISYRQCLQALAYAFPEQTAPVTSYEDVLASQLLPCPELPVQLMQDIPAAVLCGNRASFAQNCAALFQWFGQQEICDAMFVRICVLRLCYAILDRPQAERPQMSYYEFTNLQKEIMGAGSLKELRDCFENYVSVHWLHRENAAPPGRTISERVDALIEEHLSDIDFSLNDVAGELFISPNYLRQLFKQETGQTFTEYLTARRMRHAQLLLGSPEAKVYDVAEQVGYADSRYFSVCFKKMYHITPSEYQLACAQKNP